MPSPRSFIRHLAALASLLFALAWGSPALAQSAISSKVSPDLAAVVNAMPAALPTWARMVGTQRYVRVLVVATGNDTNLAALRADMLARGGSVHYVYLSVRALAGLLPVGAVNAIATRSDVLAISPNRPASRSGSLLQDSSGASAAVRSGTSLPLDGTGVGIAVLDSGIDFNHRSMLDANGKTRVSQVVDFAAYPNPKPQTPNPSHLRQQIARLTCVAL